MNTQSKRLEILKNSLSKKIDHFNSKLKSHIEDIKRANGQPMNDKRNGRSTLNRWDKQDKSLRNANKGIELTQKAIEKENWKIADCNRVKETLPQAILDMIEAGKITQWRRHPNFFFVNGVDKARIIWDGKYLTHRYLNHIIDKDQHSIFAKTFNSLKHQIFQ